MVEDEAIGVDTSSRCALEADRLTHLVENVLAYAHWNAAVRKDGLDRSAWRQCCSTAIGSPSALCNPGWNY